MAKESGLGWSTFSVDDSAGSPNTILNDVTELDFSTPRAVQDVTGLDKSAFERILLLADFQCSPKGVFNDASGQSHVTFKTVPSTSVVRTVSIGVSGQTLAAECLFTDYSLKRGNGGELTWEAPAVLANGAVPTWS